MLGFCRAHPFVLGATFHTGAAVVNYPFDGNESGLAVDTPTPDDALFRRISTSYADLNPRMAGSKQFPGGITNGAAWYVIYGSMQDWSYVWGGAFEVTVELFEQKWPAESLLPLIWEENRESLLAFTENALTAIAGAVVDCETKSSRAGRRSGRGRHRPLVAGRAHRELPPPCCSRDIHFACEGSGL